MPQSVVAGIALTPMKKGLLFSADVEQPKNFGTVFRVGAEYWIQDILALRAGYNSDFDTGAGVSAGLSVCIHEFEFRWFPIDRITFDYSFTPTDNFDYIHRAGLTLRIGAI
jgi:hypothetical protein